MKRKTGKTVVFAVFVLLTASISYAETLKGFLWEASTGFVNVEGQSVRLTQETAIERPNHKDITSKDLRVGWEVEVDVRGDATGGGLIARKTSKSCYSVSSSAFSGANTLTRRGFPVARSSRWPSWLPS